MTVRVARSTRWRAAQRPIAELRYIGDRISDKVHTLHFSDLNFGMYKRDYQICAALAELRQSKGWPLKILSTTGKNSKERIISALRQLEGSFNLTMSVQSMTPDVLTHIKRDNIKLDQIQDLAPTIREAKLPTVSEVILGLPGETKASHLDTLSQLLNAEMDNVVPYTLMMVNGSDLASEHQRRKWEMVTKWRVIPRDFTRMADGRTVVETEEVVVATNTLSFEDYVACRKVALLVAVISNMGLRALLRFLIRNGLKVMDLVERMVAAIDAASEQGSGAAAPAGLVRLVRDFERETRDELWDREEDIFAYFAEQDRFQELIDGKRGANLMQTYRAAAFAHGYEALAECAFHHAGEMVAESELGDDVSEQLSEVDKYCRGCGFNLLGSDRLETVPEANLAYDISGWLAATDQPPLAQYRWSEPRKMRFILTGEQHRQVEDGLERYGNTLLGRGKLLIRVGTTTLWRQLVTADSAELAHIEAPRFVQL
jgi:Radical SAM superfamily